MMCGKRGVLLAVGLAACFPASLRAQTVEAGPVTIRPGGVAQIQFNTTSVDERDIAPSAAALASSTFETRRVRLQFDVTIDDWITGRVQPDFAMGDLRLADAWMNLGFDERFQLRLGQFHKRFSRLAFSSSTQILPIERGVRIRGLEDALVSASLLRGRFLHSRLGGNVVVGEEHDILSTLGYAGRDLGVAAHGELGRLGYDVGVYNGEGADTRDRSDAMSFAGRLTFRPSAGVPLSFGAALSHRETRWTGTLNDVEVERLELSGSAYVLDGEWGEFRRPGLRAVAEVATGDNFLVDRSFFGAQGILAVFRALEGDRVEGLEPLFRASYGDPDTGRDGDEGWLFTPGVNVYFFGRNRVMLNWDVFRSRDEEVGTEHAFRAQAQLYF